MAECTAAERILLDALKSGGDLVAARWAVFLEWAKHNREQVEEYERAVGLARRWTRRAEDAWENLQKHGMPDSFGGEGCSPSAPWLRFYELRQKRSYFYTDEKDRPFADAELQPREEPVPQ